MSIVDPKIFSYALNVAYFYVKVPFNILQFFLQLHVMQRIFYLTSPMLVPQQQSWNHPPSQSMIMKTKMSAAIMTLRRMLRIPRNVAPSSRTIVLSTRTAALLDHTKVLKDLSVGQGPVQVLRTHTILMKIICSVVTLERGKDRLGMCAEMCYQPSEAFSE